MGIISEFKKFAVKGNVVDMAVGVIIGAAFGKIVSSLVADVFMPLLGLLVGDVDFKDIKIQLASAVLDASGQVSKEAVNLNIGMFLQTVFDFTIVAFAIFLFVKGINNLKKKEEAAPATPTTPTKEEVLLTEIRDLLKK